MILKSAFVTLKKTDDGRKRERLCLFDDTETARNWIHEMGKQGWVSNVQTIEYYRKGETPDVPPVQKRMRIE